MRPSERTRRDAGGGDVGGGDAGGSEGGRGDAGYVTAETAVVVPSLVLLVAMLLWGVMAATGVLQCVDGARAGARAAARGESPGAVEGAARAAAPPGAEVELTREGDLVRVRVTAHAAGPGPLALPLRGEAVALAEDVSSDSPEGGRTVEGRASAAASGPPR